MYNKQRWFHSPSFSLSPSQMVVVSDDVHEYAMALKDTDEKIARCPARVSTREGNPGFPRSSDEHV